MKLTYLVLMLFTLLGPLAMSFEKQIRFREKWLDFFKAVILPAFFFIVWDIVFTSKGIWSFNPAYYLGLEIFLLPLEEWLFFIIVPFAAIFVIEVVGFFIDTEKINSLAISLAICVLLLALAILYYDRLYTVTTFSMLIITIVYYEFVHRASWLSQFYIGYAVVGIGFLIINGVLTSLPVVEYNDAKNMGFRIFTIPFEDYFYGMLLIILTSGFYFKNETGEAGNELYIPGAAQAK
ncbi:MAG: hypothetical protein Kapaf2KO_02260 [Candidatus Kapaibacteriales bacterium]